MRRISGNRHRGRPARPAGSAGAAAVPAPTRRPSGPSRCSRLTHCSVSDVVQACVSACCNSAPHPSPLPARVAQTTPASKAARRSCRSAPFDARCRIRTSTKPAAVRAGEQRTGDDAIAFGTDPWELRPRRPPPAAAGGTAGRIGTRPGTGGPGGATRRHAGFVPNNAPSRCASPASTADCSSGAMSRGGQGCGQLVRRRLRQLRVPAHPFHEIDNV